MKPPDVLIRAPKRGQYDRALSRHERQAEQQERVLAAVAAVAASTRELNVASVVEHAGIGRNTFYEYYDDIEHALSAIQSRARRDLATRLEPGLALARTPLERIRAFTRVWAESTTSNPSLALLALRVQPTSEGKAGLSGLASYLATRLEGEVSSRSTLPGLADPLRILAAAAVFDAVTRAELAERASAVELQRVLSDLALRLLR